MSCVGCDQFGTDATEITGKRGGNSPVILGADKSHFTGEPVVIELPEEVATITKRSKLTLFRPNAVIRSSERAYLQENEAWLFMSQDQIAEIEAEKEAAAKAEAEAEAAAKAEEEAEIEAERVAAFTDEPAKAPKTSRKGKKKS